MSLAAVVRIGAAGSPIVLRRAVPCSKRRRRIGRTRCG
ncbi:hypothetical protein B1M_27029, partial [Burkholderia sp. TJI49]